MIFLDIESACLRFTPYVHLSMKVNIVCFVCQVEISQTMAWHLCHALGGVGKPAMSKGASSWFHNVSNYNEEVIEC